MTRDELWRELKSKIQKQKPSREAQDEYIVYTKLQPSRNRIRVFNDHLERISTGKAQTISKDDVFEFARRAMDAYDHRFSITDPNLKPGWMGSIVCSLLCLIEDKFDYRKGRVLVYHGPPIEQNEK